MAKWPRSRRIRARRLGLGGSRDSPGCKLWALKSKDQLLYFRHARLIVEDRQRCYPRRRAIWASGLGGILLPTNNLLKATRARRVAARVEAAVPGLVRAHPAHERLRVPRRVEVRAKTLDGTQEASLEYRHRSLRLRSLLRRHWFPRRRRHGHAVARPTQEARLRRHTARHRLCASGKRRCQ